MMTFRALLEPSDHSNEIVQAVIGFIGTSSMGSTAAVVRPLAVACLSAVLNQIGQRARAVVDSANHHLSLVDGAQEIRPTAEVKAEVTNAIDFMRRASSRQEGLLSSLVSVVWPQEAAATPVQRILMNKI